MVKNRRTGVVEVVESCYGVLSATTPHNYLAATKGEHLYLLSKRGIRGYWKVERALANTVEIGYLSRHNLKEVSPC